MGTKERQDRERQTVTQAILTAARELFVTEGYANVSIRKIAERIEYSPAALYSYFASKDDIFFALADEGFHRLDAKVTSALVHDDPAENVRAGWWAFYEFSKDQPEYFQLMFVDRSVPRITQQWDGFAFLQHMLTKAVAGIQKAIDAGSFPRSLNPDAAMHVLWAALVGPAVVGIRHRTCSTEDYDALARDVLEAVMTGLRAGVTTTFVPARPCLPELGADPAAAAALQSVTTPTGVITHES
jgi:AcrR family transcriptional regulator